MFMRMVNFNSGEWLEREVKKVKGLRILKKTVVKPPLAKY